MKYIWSVGCFQGGYVHNVIADKCELDISFRFYDMDFADRVEKRVKEICTALAHRNDFKIDESGMKSAIEVFIAYALNL